MQRNNNSIMIFEIIREGRTDWVGKEWPGLSFFPGGRNGPAHSFPRGKTDWGVIPACYQNALVSPHWRHGSPSVVQVYHGFDSLPGYSR